MTEIDRLALAEAARAGITGPAQLTPDFSQYSLEEFGLHLAILEGRVAVLEQRLHYVMQNGYTGFWKEGSE